MLFKYLRTLVIIVAVTISAAWQGSSAMATTYYVDGGTGSDSNPGTNPLAPRKSLPADATLNDGDTVLLAGEIHSATVPAWATTGGPAIFSYTKNNLTFANWPGQTAPNMRGDWKLNQTGWAASTNAWQLTIDSGLTTSVAINVLYKWDANINGSGQHYGHLVSDTLVNVQNAVGAIGRYNYNNATGVLTVYLGGANPNTSGFPVSVVSTEQQIGIKITGGSRHIISGITFSLYCGGGQCYGCRIDNSRNSEITACTFLDSGFHGCGFFNSTAGGVQNYYNIISGCTFRGMRHDGTFTVHFTEGGAEGSIALAKVWWCSFHPYRFLGTDGNVLSGLSANAQFCVYAHNNGAALAVADLECGGCAFTAYAGEIPQAMIDGGLANVPDPANGRVWSNYAVRADLCTFTNLTEFRTLENFAIKRSFIDIPRIDSGNEPIDHSGVINFAALRANGFGLMESCAVTFNATTLTTYAILLGLNQTGQQFYRTNNSFHDASTDNDPSHGRIFMGWGNANDRYHRARGDVYSSVIVGAGNALCFFDQTTDAAHHDILDCAYWNVRAGTWSWNASFDTQAEWVATIDTAARVLASAPFPNAPTNLQLTMTSSLWALRRTTSTIQPKAGINAAYDGEYGAWQYPPAPCGRADRTERGFRAAR